MAPQPQFQPDPASATSGQARWGLPLRVAFRFLLLYFGLFSLLGQILGGLLPILGLDIPNLAELPPFRGIVLWTAAHIFRTASPLIYTDTGSGDRTFDWVLTFCLLMTSAAGTILWSASDRKRSNYISLHKWFHLGLRFAVGSQFLIYGMGKLIPTQMPFPPLAKLVEPFGDFSPASVLWYSIGSAPAYEMFVGAAEIFGAMLLFFPRTAMFGALVCLADATEVFVLNMTYDVGVKLFSFHLVVMSLVLLAPELRRLFSFFFTDGGTPPSARLPLFRTKRANRNALAVQAVYALILVVMNVIVTRGYRRQVGPDAPKSALYGIWNVDRDAPESKTWRRVVFDRPTYATFQHPDDSLEGFGAAIDAKAGSITLSKPANPNWKANFRFQRPAAGQLTLDGEMNGAPLHLQLHQQDRNKLMLISRGFHWVQERPFYR
jgi:hypothetical protein